MSYGVFQDYYLSTGYFRKAHSTTGAVGTTANGAIYVAMPILFALSSLRWSQYTRLILFMGIVIQCLGFFLSSFATVGWEIITTQGIIAALGSCLVFSSITLLLKDSYTADRRAVALGIVLSCKNVTGSTCPFLLRYLLDQYGYRTTMQIWTGITGFSSLLAIFILPAASNRSTMTGGSVPLRSRGTWRFLSHTTFWIYSAATFMQAIGYGIPQTYLNSYAHETASLTQTSSTLLLVLFNLPGILSSFMFGYLSDNKHIRQSAGTMTFWSSFPAALGAFFLWGLAPKSSMVGLVWFALLFGFFASGYSATWGAVLRQAEVEAAERDETLDVGLFYGMLNGSRGLGYITGGVASVLMFRGEGMGSGMGASGFQTEYKPLILLTGISSLLGGLGILASMRQLSRLGSCS